MRQDARAIGNNPIAPKNNRLAAFVGRLEAQCAI